MQTTRHGQRMLFGGAALEDPFTQTWPARNPCDTEQGEQEAAAQRMREDFRAWLEWRDADAARAQAAAEFARDPAVWADPSAFKRGSDGAIVPRTVPVSEVKKLADEGIHWMHAPTIDTHAHAHR
jgi:hypothetical protein